ncbi:hypothetical protein MRX96_045537 [Rhipicephalus microplus]
MRKETFVLLALLFGPVVGGGQQSKQKALKGCGPNDHGDKKDPSPCGLKRCQTTCVNMAHSWYYNPSLKMCLGGDTAYCGMTGNQYPNCEACMKACNGRILQETRYRVWSAEIRLTSAVANSKSEATKKQA